MTTEEILDKQFLERLKNRITSNCSLPFNLPDDAIPPIIAECAMRYYDISRNSCVKKIYVIRAGDLRKEGNNFIAILPDQIYAVDLVEDGYNGGIGRRSDFSTEKLLMSNIYSPTGMYAGVQPDLVMSVMAMYELSTLDQLTFKSLQYNFNRFSHTLIIEGQYRGTNLVLGVFERIKLQDLYNDQRFFDYVRGEVLKQLGFIYETFELNYIGGVKPNFAMWMEMGQQMIDKVEAYHENIKTVPILRMPRRY